MVYLAMDNIDKVVAVPKFSCVDRVTVASTYSHYSNMVFLVLSVADACKVHIRAKTNMDKDGADEITVDNHWRPKHRAEQNYLSTSS